MYVAWSLGNLNLAFLHLWQFIFDIINKLISLSIFFCSSIVVSVWNQPEITTRLVSSPYQFTKVCLKVADNVEYEEVLFHKVSYNQIKCFEITHTLQESKRSLFNLDYSLLPCQPVLKHFISNIKRSLESWLIWLFGAVLMHCFVYHLFGDFFMVCYLG